ncbi:hypothetical protein I317_06082 [Kwoniella heveanensis CBS 569]|nr:hypothetical protein I317_06082 [Kwoniella heveanensis CBS 569]
MMIATSAWLLLVALSSPIVAQEASRSVSEAGFTSPAWSEGLWKARATVAEMTFDEKVNMTNGAATTKCGFELQGVPRLGINRLCFTGGPAGNTNSRFSSTFPATLTLAATWDRDLAHQRGFALGSEFKAQGVNGAGSIVVGPLGRSPYGGRNWESYSPDPYMTSVMVGQTVAGWGGSGCGGIIKHFIGNEQVTLWTDNGYVTDNITRIINDAIDDATMHEVYLAPFAEAVRFGAPGVMCSYNGVNGSLACENSQVLDLLKSELNFPGYVVTDFGAVFNGTAAAVAGTDFIAPGGANSVWANSFWRDAIDNGTVTESRLDDAVTRNLLAYYALAQDADDYPTPDFQRWVVNSSSIITEIGKEALTLVKNSASESTGLPITKSVKSIGVFGDTGPRFVGNWPWTSITWDGGINATRHGGYQISGGGSGGSPPPFIVSPYEAIKPQPDGLLSAVEYPLAVDAARVQKAIVFVSSYAQEGYDRTTLKVDRDGDELIAKVASICNDTVVVVNTVGQIDMSAWADNDNVTAILFAYLPGMYGGDSLVPVLFGEESPSGHLPWTIARDISDYDSNTIYNNTYHPTTEFSEGELLDYRYFDKKGIEPLYEFGFGLSYTTFKMSDLKITANHIGDIAWIRETNEIFLNSTDLGQGLYDQSYEVNMTITNTGAMDAKAVAQLYISQPDNASPTRPLRTLKGFEKVMIPAGDSVEVQISVRNKDIAVWSTDHQGWYIQPGQFTLATGFSSRDLPLSTEIFM